MSEEWSCRRCGDGFFGTVPEDGPTCWACVQDREIEDLLVSLWLGVARDDH